MTRLFYLLLCLTTLGGCTKTQEVNTAGGEPAFRINCSGGMQTWAHCHEAAGDHCGREGFDIIDKSGDLLDVTEMHYGL